MPTIERIKASEAPAPPKKLTPQTAEILSALGDLAKDEVLKLSPDEGKNIRGLKTSIGRIASNAGIKITSYEVDDSLYVKKA